MTIDLDALISKEPVDKLAAYRDCLIVMLHCTPSLRKNEILSITPETAEIWRTMHDGTRHYCWRYKPSKIRMNADENIILIPNTLVPLAQKAINRLRELYSENLVKNYLKRCNSEPELRIDFRAYRRSYVERLERCVNINLPDLLKFTRFIEDEKLFQYYL